MATNTDMARMHKIKQTLRLIDKWEANIMAQIQTMGFLKKALKNEYVKYGGSRS